MAGEREKLVAACKQAAEGCLEVGNLGAAQQYQATADLLEADAAELAILRELLRTAPVRKGPFNWFVARDKALASPRNEAKDKGEGK